MNRWIETEMNRERGREKDRQEQNRMGKSEAKEEEVGGRRVRATG